MSIISAAWKDQYFTYETEDDFIDYRLVDDDGDVFFTGRCYNKGDNLLTIKISELYQQKLSNIVDFNNLLEFNDYKYAYLHFSLQSRTSAGGDFNEDEDYTIIYDWSYDVNVDEDTQHCINKNIYKTVDPRQYIFPTFYLPDAGDVTIYLNDSPIISEMMDHGGIYTAAIKVSNLTPMTPGGFSTGFSNGFTVSTPQPIIGSTISFNGEETYTIKDTCRKFCLYYLNDIGGWDYMIVDGNEIRTDNYTDYKYRPDFDNTTHQFGEVKYMKNIKDSWALTTGYMTDDDSFKMTNLVSSMKIYLHDLEMDKVIPVNVTDGSHIWKTFKNQGRKLYNYTINVETAQPRMKY